MNGLKTKPFLKFVSPVYDEAEKIGLIISKCSVLHPEKTGILNVTAFKYSLHKFRETILH